MNPHLNQLDESQRQILELRRQGHAVEDIASLVACSGRTVRRKLQRIEAFLAEKLNSGTWGTGRLVPFGWATCYNQTFFKIPSRGVFTGTHS